MTKQLARIRDLIIHMERMWSSVDQDVLVDVRDFAEFVFQWIRNAKVYSAADARVVWDCTRIGTPRRMIFWVV